MRIGFWCDGGELIGIGHAMRCVTLARAFLGGGHDASISVPRGTLRLLPRAARMAAMMREADVDDTGRPDPALIGETDIAIVDSYRTDSVFESALRGPRRAVVAVDDLTDRDHSCDFLLNPSPGFVPDDYRGRTPAGCRFLLGAEFAPVAPEYAKLRADIAAAPCDLVGLRRVFVGFGGTDPSGVTPRVVRLLDRLGLTAEIAIGPGAACISDLMVVGSPSLHVHVDPPDMPCLMAGCDVAIAACGSSSWERCTLGLPTLAVRLARNQDRIADALVAGGAAADCGQADEGLEARLEAALASVARDPHRLAGMRAAAFALCDGQGATRVVEALAA